MNIDPPYEAGSNPGGNVHPSIWPSLDAGRLLGGISSMDQGFSQSRIGRLSLFNIPAEIDSLHLFAPGQSLRMFSSLIFSMDFARLKRASSTVTLLNLTESIGFNCAIRSMSALIRHAILT